MTEYHTTNHQPGKSSNFKVRFLLNVYRFHTTVKVRKLSGTILGQRPPVCLVILQSKVGPAGWSPCAAAGSGMSAMHSSPARVSSAEAGGARTRLAWTLLAPWPHGQLVCAATRRDNLRASQEVEHGDTG